MHKAEVVYVINPLSNLMNLGIDDVLKAYDMARNQ